MENYEGEAKVEERHIESSVIDGYGEETEQEFSFQRDQSLVDLATAELECLQEKVQTLVQDDQLLKSDQKPKYDHAYLDKLSIHITKTLDEIKQKPLHSAVMLGTTGHGKSTAINEMLRATQIAPIQYSHMKTDASLELTSLLKDVVKGKDSKYQKLASFLKGKLKLPAANLEDCQEIDLEDCKDIDLTNDINLDDCLHNYLDDVVEYPREGDKELDEMVKKDKESAARLKDYVKQPDISSMPDPFLLETGKRDNADSCTSLGVPLRFGTQFHGMLRMISVDELKKTLTSVPWKALQQQQERGMLEDPSDKKYFKAMKMWWDLLKEKEEEKEKEMERPCYFSGLQFGGCNEEQKKQQ
mmetsp:Transcript_44293/g.86657  ORF Transcript_44293/g.86657 Transcript_44293/m.86657 type:complete len:357 (+) Transcript_44293:459-1529(+)